MTDVHVIWTRTCVWFFESGEITGCCGGALKTLLVDAAQEDGDGFASRSGWALTQGRLAEARLTLGLNTEGLWPSGKEFSLL